MGDPEPIPPTPTPRPRRWWIPVISGVVLTLLVRCVVTVCVVEGVSMEPTLTPGQYLLIERIGTPERGDLVVFDNPLAPGEWVVKRAVGGGADTLEARHGALYVGGVLLAERYRRPGWSQDLPRSTVPEDHLYVLGDNRQESVDSRRFGPIDRRRVVGRVVARLWPWVWFGL